jgi:hypothetical protein
MKNIKKNSLFFLVVLFNSAVSFSQWVTIEKSEPQPLAIFCNKQEIIELKKESDTISFYTWYENTFIDCPGIQTLDKTMLERAYAHAKQGEFIYEAGLPEASLELNSANYLFRNFDNYLSFSANWLNKFSNFKLETTDATIKKIVRDNEVQFSVNPKGTNCTISLLVKDDKGNEKTLKTWEYKVISIPTPAISVQEISKTEGAEIILQNSEFLPSAEFFVERIELIPLHVVIIDDAFILGKTVSKLKRGSKLPILVTVSELSSGEKYTIQHTLIVKE